MSTSVRRVAGNGGKGLRAEGRHLVLSASRTLGSGASPELAALVMPLPPG